MKSLLLKDYSAKRKMAIWNSFKERYEQYLFYEVDEVIEALDTEHEWFA